MFDRILDGIGYTLGAWITDVLFFIIVMVLLILGFYLTRSRVDEKKPVKSVRDNKDFPTRHNV